MNPDSQMLAERRSERNAAGRWHALRRPAALPSQAAIIFLLLVCVLPITNAIADGAAPSLGRTDRAERMFPVRGILKETGPDQHTITVDHEAIPGYMDAMSMPFKARAPKELESLKPGDQITFTLHVTATESWIDEITRVGGIAGASLPPPASAPARPGTSAAAVQSRHPLMNYCFTNELRQPVRLSDFDGQALAITFFFTRCPIPDYCPRLSKNFQEASARLHAMPNAPTNWHFISVTMDPQFDTPGVLKAYARAYDYDPARWTFLTGPVDKIAELARLSDVRFDTKGGLLNHNFRTLIISASGGLQCVFPVSGNLSEPIVSEILKAASAGHVEPSAASAPPPGQDANSPSYRLPNGRTEQVRGALPKPEVRNPNASNSDQKSRNSGPAGSSNDAAANGGVDPAGNAQARANLPGH